VSLTGDLAERKAAVRVSLANDVYSAHIRAKWNPAREDLGLILASPHHEIALEGKREGYFKRIR
jgi:hypothetical protein